MDRNKMIMPCDYSKYPPNWKTEIRPAILKRAGNRCEWCGVENHAVGFRDANGDFWEEDGERWMPSDIGEKLIKIVLTIAHIHDPNPMNCEPENLAALCQKCHNGHDAKMRQRNRKKRIEKENGVLKLFKP